MHPKQIPCPILVLSEAHETAPVHHRNRVMHHSDAFLAKIASSQCFRALIVRGFIGGSDSPVTEGAGVHCSRSGPGYRLAPVRGTGAR